jgi:hypothetical protein
VDVLGGLAILSLVLLGAAGVALVAAAAWLAVDDDRGVWTAAELAAIPRPSGRHRTDGHTAADLIGRGGWTPRHDEDEVPPNIRPITMELPVVTRARVLAWEHGITRRPVAPPPRRLRLVQLGLARRLRAAGHNTTLRPRLEVVA